MSVMIFLLYEINTHPLLASHRPHPAPYNKYIIFKIIHMLVLVLINLEAFTVDDAGTGLVIFLLANPHLLEGGERGED